MKIKGTCKRDGREFMIDQVLESGGACPWDGEPFDNDYAVVLVDALRDAQELGTQLVGALENVASLRPEMTIQVESVLGPIREQLVRLGENLVVHG